MDFFAISGCDTQREIFIVRFRCIVSTIIYYLIHFWCTVFGETVCISYSVICDILFDGAATSGISLQLPALTNADWLHWSSCYIFTRESSYCSLLSSHLSHRNSVRPSVCLSVCSSHRWISQKRCKLGLPNFHRRLHGTIVMRSWWRIWYLYINLAWTPQFLAKLLNQNCYRLSRVSWALAQISCLH